MFEKAGRPAAEREKIAARRADVARLYPTMSITDIAVELGCSRKPIEDDVNALAAAGVLEKRPRGRVPGTKLGPESREKIAAAKKDKPRPDVAARMRGAWADPRLRADLRDRLTRVPRETRRCEWCGRPFERPTTSPQRFCSISHAHHAWWGNWRSTDAARILPGATRRIFKLKRTKSPGAPTKWHPGTRAEVRRLRAEGLSWNDIAAEFRITNPEQASSVSARPGTRSTSYLKATRVSPASHASCVPATSSARWALLDGGPRSATIPATTPVRAMRLPRRAFMEALDGDPHISRAIMAVLAARVRAA
jgi:hypothetical protein